MPIYLNTGVYRSPNRLSVRHLCWSSLPVAMFLLQWWKVILRKQGSRFNFFITISHTHLTPAAHHPGHDELDQAPFVALNWHGLAQSLHCFLVGLPQQRLSIHGYQLVVHPQAAILAARSGNMIHLLVLFPVKIHRGKCLHQFKETILALQAAPPLMMDLTKMPRSAWFSFERLPFTLTPNPAEPESFRGISKVKNSRVPSGVRTKSSSSAF